MTSEQHHMNEEIGPTNRISAPHYQWGTDGECDGWRLLHDPELSVIEEVVPPGNGEEQPHFHQHARQFFYILSGEAGMELGSLGDDGSYRIDRVITLGPGQGVHIPPFTPHRFVNHSAQPVRFLVISSPSTSEDRVVAG